MKINIAYGKRGLSISLNDELNIDIIEPHFNPPLSTPFECIQDSLRHPYNSSPLRDWISKEETVGIVFSDITRPVPLKIILPVILGELSHINKDNIILFNGLGSHRPNTENELRRMLSDEIFEDYTIIQNDAFSPSSQDYFGKTSRGHDIYLNRDFASCDRHILTGFIEPHFFAGFSGGGKAIMPGMAGIETIMKNHGADMIADPKSSFGITEGNPIWEEITEVGMLLENTFLVNVTLNKDKQITGVFSGELKSAHAAGCSFIKESAMIPVQEPYDIVITTNSGYPLDMNLYQSVKGMSAASRIVREGGSIIIATECSDGIPEHGNYGSLLGKSRSPQEFLNTILTSDRIISDQWQAQIQAQIQLRADIYVYSDYLQPSEIESALLIPCENIEKKIEDLVCKYGKNTRICILPEGPQTIPYLV